MKICAYPVRRDSASSRRMASVARLGLDRQVAVERESLSVHAGGHQREQDRRRPDQRHDDDSLAMRGGDDAARRVGDAWAAGVATEARGRAPPGSGASSSSQRCGVGCVADLHDVRSAAAAARVPATSGIARAGLAFSTTKWARPRATRDGARRQHVLRAARRRAGWERGTSRPRIDSMRRPLRRRRHRHAGEAKQLVSRISGRPISAVGSSLVDPLEQRDAERLRISTEPAQS